jgi:hypothetical protein
MAIPRGIAMKEFIVKYKNGKYDWIDPVDDVEIVVGEGMATTLVVEASTGYTYTYLLIDIDQWVVRDYDEDNIYPFGEHSEERRKHLEAVHGI